MERDGFGRQNAPCETLLYFAQPRGEFLAAAWFFVSQFENAFFDFPDADDADEQAGFILLIQPGDYFRRGWFFSVFGKHTSIQQPTHKSMLRPVSRLREKSRSTIARSGHSRAAESLPRLGRVSPRKFFRRYDDRCRLAVYGDSLGIAARRPLDQLAEVALRLL